MPYCLRHSHSILAAMHCSALVECIGDLIPEVECFTSIAIERSMKHRITKLDYRRRAVHAANHNAQLSLNLNVLLRTQITGPLILALS